MSTLLFVADDSVTIQSLESVTTDGKPVYNQIKYIPGLKRDIWMMNQSHHGLKTSPDKWDRLAIVVNKTNAERTAKFLQLPPGKLEWNENLHKQGINYRVSCFMCHSNGPRAIRPNYNGQAVDLFSKVKIQLWNLRIKTYGRVWESEEHKALDAKLVIPFRHRSKIDNDELQVESCIKCHSEKGWVKRGHLTRQNAVAIQFMINNNIMPPAGFSLNNKDKAEIQKFISGL